MSRYRNLWLFLSVLGALAIFSGSWAELHRGWFARGQIIDTPVYENYGDAMWRGDVPYRDFGVEYPPGALPTFALPAYREAGNLDEYKRPFETLMAACGALLLVGLALGLYALDASLPRFAGAMALAAVSPLLVGSVILSRYDLWPAALTACALAALLWGRFRLGHGLLGLGIVTKVWPAVLVPIAVAHAWRTRGRREGLICLGVAVAVVALAVLPFAALAPHGVWKSFERQLSRPLQIESVGAALVVASHHLLGTGVAMVSSSGSQNIAGITGKVVGVLQSLAQLAALVAVWFVFARRERSREELVQYAAAAVVAFVAFGKVLSPQYMIWLIAVIPLVRRWSAWALYVAALVLTQAWFPQKYWSYALGFSAHVTWLVLARDLVLLALLVVLLAPMPRRRLRPAFSAPARAPAAAGASGRRPASSSRA